MINNIKCIEKKPNISSSPELIPVDMKIHGVEQTINIPLTLVESSKNNYIINSSFSILLSDFNIDIPKLLFLPINNEIIIKVKLVIRGIEP